ncbi:cytochrome P450 [Xylariaceae sp. AK1471]|nr:cytochrome P450 [Xylariaceae sp. AK1471]
MSFILEFDNLCTTAYLAISLCWFIHWCLGPLIRHRRAEHRVKKYRRIADFTALNAGALEERLKLRAKPNARLVLAFNLDNSFTTVDKHVHQEFLKRANNAIRLVRTQDWIELGKVTETILNLCMEYFRRELPYVPLAPLVRVVSFSLVLHVLFDVEPSEIDLSEARIATDAINRLWTQSKDQNSIPSLYDKTLLNNALSKLLPQQFPCDRASHPLNLIMPAYETLWRVVLQTFVSVASRNRDPNTWEALQEAVENVPQCFCQKGNDVEARVLSIAKEGLRLYPPTKRVYRATSIEDGDSGIIAADVEACHRDCEVWGPDALEFKPARFHNWSREDTTKSQGQSNRFKLQTENFQKFNYFPFSVGTHACPAAAGFGERIITLLVIELTRHFWTRQKGLKIHFGNVEVQEQHSAPLPSGRDDMENWVLEVEGGDR